MFKTETVLVLGAGASCPYDFPSGYALRRKVESCGGVFLRDMGVLGLGDLDRFYRTLRRSQTVSVDTFIEGHPDLAQIGKICIAYVLLEHEGRGDPCDAKFDKHAWYYHLFNYMRTSRMAELALNRLRVVTFNYDRSLEYAFRMFIENTYDGTREEYRAAYESLRVLHVYGSLGTLDQVSYGARRHSGNREVLHPEDVKMAAESIKLVPEDREHDGTWERFEVARAWLADAKRVFFLGFGYDRTNLNRLGLGSDSEPGTRKALSSAQAEIVGTCFNMKPSERGCAWRDCSRMIKLGWPNEDIITFLRGRYNRYGDDDKGVPPIEDCTALPY